MDVIFPRLAVIYCDDSLWLMLPWNPHTHARAVFPEALPVWRQISVAFAILLNGNHAACFHGVPKLVIIQPAGRLQLPHITEPAGREEMIIFFFPIFALQYQATLQLKHHCYRVGYLAVKILDILPLQEKLRHGGNRLQLSLQKSSIRQIPGIFRGINELVLFPAGHVITTIKPVRVLTAKPVLITIIIMKSVQ